MKRLAAALVVCAAGMGTRCVAQTGQEPLSLPDAMRRALTANPALTRAAHETAAARQRIREARAATLPSVSIQGAATDGPLGAPAFGLSGLAGDPLKRHYGGGLNVTETLYDFGRTEHLVAARQALARAAEQDAGAERARVLLDVQAAYLYVLRRQQLVGVQEANVRQREATVTQAQTFAASGLKADVDAQLARANLSEAQVALTAARNDVRLGFAALNNAMGATSLTEYALAPPAPSPQPPNVATVESLVPQALRQRPEVRRAAQEVAAAEQSIRAARSDLLPRIDTIGSVGAINPSPLIKANKDYAVGLALTIPLYTGGAVEGRIAEERERRDAAVAQQREVEEAVKLQVARAWLAVQTRQAELVAAEAQAAAAGAAAEQAAERYRLQLNTIVELTEAQAAALRAETQRVNARFDLDAARAELDWATGTTVASFPRPVR